MTIRSADDWARAPVWSLLAFAPAVAVLWHGRAVLFALLYAASSLVALGYHLSRERRYVALDHALAFSVIAANTHMAWAGDLRWASVGVALVLASVLVYWRAKQDRPRYDYWHSLWHLGCGLAGWAFALGYVGQR